MGSAIALPEGSVKAISPSGIQEKVVTTEGPLHILETKEIKQLVQDMAKAVVVLVKPVLTASDSWCPRLLGK